MSDALFRKLVAAASASPSVHNVQPARWRIEGERLVLLEDRTRRLAVGDPTGHDAAISLGAAAEGLHLAASLEGVALAEQRNEGEWEGYRRVAAFEPSGTASPDPLAKILETRASWRGRFRPPGPAERATAEALAGEDRTIIADPKAIRRVARLYDEASYGFMRSNGFRRELRSWMRLRRSHPGWERDGLNAEAMRLGRIEAFGAGMVLGPLFAPLAALGIAPALLAERDNFGNAAGIALFHRPQGEDPYESGRHFHRLWLAIEAAGLGANVLAALADDKAAAARIAEEFALPEGRRLVSAFRFGLRDGGPFPRARLPLDELIV
jgi:hypothetical protein